MGKRIFQSEIAKIVVAAFFAFTGATLSGCRGRLNALSNDSLTPSGVLALGPEKVTLHEGMSASFFPTGGLPPYTFSVAGGGSITSKTNGTGEVFGAFVAPNNAATVTVTVTDFLGETATSTASVTSSALVNTMIASSTGGVGYAYLLQYDPTSNTFSGLSASNSTSMTLLRGFTLLSDGELLLGDASTVSAQPVSPGMALGSALSLGTTGSPLTGAHGLCTLPNGDIIAGDENNATENTVAEFKSDGTYIRTVFLPGSDEITGSHPGMSNCTPLGNEDLIFYESDTWTGTMADAVRVQLINNQWREVQRFSGAAFDTAQGTSGTIVWVGKAHTDGNLYMASSKLTGTQAPKIIKCPLSDITASNCTQVGTQNLPTGGYFYGINQIPGSQDMLLSTNHIIYRYDYAAGTFTNICDVNSNTSSCYISATAFIRGIILQ